MKGDFSQWKHDPNQNFSGVLHQQGRVLLDTDWNAQTQITSDWQDTAARDAFGPGVAAVPAGDRDAFKVTGAIINGTQVEVTLQPGRVWADGLLVYLAEETRLDASYLRPPIQDPPATPNWENTRDAVILEVWREAINGFQLPNDLIEPALGGPDTTERMHTAMALKLYRLGPGETCETIRQQIQDDFAAKGKLTVSLHPTTATSGDCPVTAKGGYTGFEHSLYRIEIAQVNSDSPMFKYSRFNGGLVGRGNCDLSAADKKITITANKPAIVTSDLDRFYLEVLEEDRDRGHWRVTYGAEATLNGDELEITAVHYSESSVPSGNQFFRLWDGIQLISAFPPITSPTEPKELADGIRLEFDPATAPMTNYQPGDYWTFAVRADEIENRPILINHEPPAGIHYHRVPLAELTWNTSNSVNADNIKDCRKIFRPLTNQKVCCTYTVGNGADFASIQEAVNALKIRQLHNQVEAGKICLLPGIHQANVTIEDCKNIVITGCDAQTIVHPDPDLASGPIFNIQDSQNIQLEHMALMSIHGTTIQVNDSDNTQNPSIGITINHNQITAGIHGIYIKVNNQIKGDNNIQITNNQIGILDKPEGKTGIFCCADGVMIEGNKIVVIPAPNPDNPDEPRNEDDPINIAEGGIQIGSSSEQVEIVDNTIIGGRGNGITLGSYLEDLLPNNDDIFAFISDVTIEDNQIYNMGFSGIGTPQKNFDFLSKNPKSKLKDTYTQYKWDTIYPIISSLAMIFGVIGSFVINLKIQKDNHISHCLQNFGQEVGSLLLLRGEGGISLGICENLTICDNQIEENGVNHLEPVCGIFVSYGGQVEISRNHILNNGLLDTDVGTNLQPGIRGGIVLRFVTSISGFSTPELFAGVNTPVERGIVAAYAMGGYAAHIHNNTIRQPVGQSLNMMIAWGPVSVLNNQLNTDYSNYGNLQIPILNVIEGLAGTVFILNFGGLGSHRSIKSIKTDQPPYILPKGDTLFSHNQTRLGVAACRTSQLIATQDDLGFDGNQSDILVAPEAILKANTFLLARTLRAMNNCLKEFSV